MKFLLFLLLSLSAYAEGPTGSVNLYVVSSPKGLNWGTPQALLWSVQKNRLTFHKRPLGVVFTELACPDSEEIYTSYYETLDFFNQLFVKQRGLGVLFHSYPGKLEKGSELLDELADYIREGKVRFISFRVNAQSCQRAQDYLKEYAEKNVARHWGLPHRPIMGEGGTSIALAVSVLEVLGFKEEIFDQGWRRTMLVPLSDAGQPVTDNSVSIFKVFSANWARRDEPYQALFLWDKDLMYNWIGVNQKNFPSTQLRGVNGIFLDRAHFPTLQSPIWRQHTDPEYQKK